MYNNDDTTHYINWLKKLTQFTENNISEVIVNRCPIIVLLNVCNFIHIVLRKESFLFAYSTI